MYIHFCFPAAYYLSRALFYRYSIKNLCLRYRALYFVRTAFVAPLSSYHGALINLDYLSISLFNLSRLPTRALTFDIVLAHSRENRPLGEKRGWLWSARRVGASVSATLTYMYVCAVSRERMSKCVCEREKRRERRQDREERREVPRNEGSEDESGTTS